MIFDREGMTADQLQAAFDNVGKGQQLDISRPNGVAFGGKIYHSGRIIRTSDVVDVYLFERSSTPKDGLHLAHLCFSDSDSESSAIIDVNIRSNFELDYVECQRGIKIEKQARMITRNFLFELMLMPKGVKA